jgi:sugar-specific transcriptional regulator TrmB
MTSDIANFSLLDPPLESKSYDYEMLLEKLKNELSKFGLTSNQSKVFLFLEKYGPSTATQVSKTLKVPRTETYHLLTHLQNKGIVSATFQHPIKFSALSLNKAIGVLINTEKERVKTLENQEKGLVDLWNTIPNFRVDQNDIKEGKFQMLQGINQLTGKINEMIANTKTELLILGSEKDFMKFYHSGFLEQITGSKIEAKLITSSSKKTFYIFDKKLVDKVKKMPSKIKENLCFIIKDDGELLLFMKNVSESQQNSVAMWTDSTSMIYTMRLLFSYIWSNSRHIQQ